MNKLEGKKLIQDKVGKRRKDSGFPSYTKSERRLLEELVRRIRINTDPTKYRNQQIEDTFCEAPVKNLAKAIDCSIERTKRFLSRLKRDGLIVQSTGKNHPRYTATLDKIAGWPDVKQPWTVAERCKRHRAKRNITIKAQLKEMEEKIKEQAAQLEALRTVGVA